MHTMLCAISEPLLDDVFAWADSLVWCFYVVVLFFLFQLQCLELAVTGDQWPHFPPRAYQYCPGSREALDACWGPAGERECVRLMSIRWRSSLGPLCLSRAFLERASRHLWLARLQSPPCPSVHTAHAPQVQTGGKAVWPGPIRRRHAGFKGGWLVAFSRPFETPLYALRSRLHDRRFTQPTKPNAHGSRMRCLMI